MELLTSENPPVVHGCINPLQLQKFSSNESDSDHEKFILSLLGSPLSKKEEKSFSDFPLFEGRKSGETTTTASCAQEPFFNSGKVDRCKCKKSQCLRLHCACFSNNGVCGKLCSCFDCMNREEFEGARQFVIQKTKEINPLAFKSKVRTVDSSDKLLNTQGCKCLRNNCRQKYCECFKLGVGCSNVCRCKSCFNDKRELGQNIKQEFQKRIFRKKHKIVISSKQPGEPETNLCTRSITYVPHRKKQGKTTSA